jgi:hypothetical protein
MNPRFSEFAGYTKTTLFLSSNEYSGLEKQTELLKSADKAQNGKDAK